MFSCAPKGENITLFLGYLSYKYLWKYSSNTVLLVLLTRHTKTWATHRTWSADTITHTVLLHSELQRPGFAPDFDVWQWWRRWKDMESETWRSNVLDVTWRLWIPLIKSLHGVQTAAINWLAWFFTYWVPDVSFTIGCFFLDFQLLFLYLCLSYFIAQTNAANQCILGG